MLSDHLHRPLVSVIIPTFNRADLLCKAIRSVQQQTYRHFELLVIDDHSADQTEDHVRASAAQDERIRYICNLGPKGISSARNCGLDHCTGEFVALLDSDDLWMPDHLEDAVATLQTDPAVSLYFGNRMQFDLLTGRDLEPPFPSHWLLERVPHELIGAHSYRLGREFLELLFTGNPIAVSGAVFRKESIRSLRFDETLVASEDRDFWLRLCLGERVLVGFQDKVVTRIARHCGNMSGYHAEARLNLLQSHLRIFTKVLDEGRISAPQRESVKRQFRSERALLPYALRQAGHWVGALRAALSNWRMFPLWVTALELGKTIVCWVLSPIRRSGGFAHRRAGKAA